LYAHSYQIGTDSTLKMNFLKCVGQLIDVVDFCNENDHFVDVDGAEYELDENMNLSLLENDKLLVYKTKVRRWGDVITYYQVDLTNGGIGHWVSSVDCDFHRKLFTCTVSDSIGSVMRRNAQVISSDDYIIAYGTRDCVGIYKYEKGMHKYKLDLCFKMGGLYADPDMKMVGDSLHFKSVFGKNVVSLIDGVWKIK